MIPGFFLFVLILKSLSFVHIGSWFSMREISLWFGYPGVRYLSLFQGNVQIWCLRWGSGKPLHKGTEGLGLKRHTTKEVWILFQCIGESRQKTYKIDWFLQNLYHDKRFGQVIEHGTEENLWYSQKMGRAKLNAIRSVRKEGSNLKTSERGEG